MENEIIRRSEINNYYPNFFEGFKKAKAVIDSVRNFDDIELHLLKGQGLAAGSYKVYMVAVRQLYDFTQGLNPFQVTPAIVEGFYDHVMKMVDRNTAYNKIMGLKRFFQGIKTLAPGWVSPFEIMPGRLIRKLRKTKKTKTKKALTIKEVQDLLSWLSEDQSEKGISSYAIIYMLVTSGLRASELCQLRRGDLEYLEGTWTARFIGKGGDEEQQELYPPAVEACLELPQRGEYLFYSHIWNKDTRQWVYQPMQPHGLWFRIQQVGKKARAADVIKRDLQFCPHLFRRSYATALYKSGMKLKAIQEKTRHSSIEVLAKHYIHDEEPASPYFEKILSKGIF